MNHPAYKKFQKEAYALNLANFTDKPFETDGTGTVTVLFQKGADGYGLNPEFTGECSEEFKNAVIKRCKTVHNIIKALTV